MEDQQASDRMGPQTRFRRTNAVLGLIEKFRAKRSFEIGKDEVLRVARRNSGVAHFDCSEFGAPLQMLCETLSNPRMTPTARARRRKQIINRVTNRLHLAKVLQDEPQLQDEPLEKPWFILGLPRSGTTLLHRLLAQDPKHRAPLYWETVFPFPRHERDTQERRMKSVRVGTMAASYLAPELKAMHEVGAELPEECNALLANSLAGGVWHGGSPRFNAWLAALDKTPAYRLHRMQLQYLQRNAAKKTWILKSPIHLPGLKFLLNVYPDARIVQLHRHPLEALPSWASIAAFFESSEWWRQDLHECGRRIYAEAKQAYYPSFLDDGTRPSGSLVTDVRYSDLAKNPLETVEKIYQAFNCAFTDEARSAMQAFLSGNPRHKHGRHQYTLEQFGLDRETICQELAPYIARYRLNA